MSSPERIKGITFYLTPHEEAEAHRLATAHLPLPCLLIDTDWPKFIGTKWKYSVSCPSCHDIIGHVYVPSDILDFRFNCPNCDYDKTAHTTLLRQESAGAYSQEPSYLDLTTGNRVVSSLPTLVANFNRLLGNPEGKLGSIDFDRLANQVKNLPDEFIELQDAIASKNPTEIRDAICDILVYTLGAAYLAGMDVEADMMAVDESNRSKTCATQAILDATLEKYKALGLECFTVGEFPNVFVKSSKDQTSTKGEFFPANKGLKSVSYRPPQGFSSWKEALVK